MILLQDKTPIHPHNTYHTEHASISFEYMNKHQYQKSLSNAKDATTCKVIPDSLKFS